MPAKYRVCLKSYLKVHGDGFDRIYEVGAEIEFDGKPGSALEPLNDEAWAAIRAQAVDDKRMGRPLRKYLWKRDWPTDPTVNEKGRATSAPGWSKPKVAEEAKP